MYNIDDLNLNSNGAFSYEESQMYCEYLSATSHLYEPRDATTREQVLLAINETFETTGHTYPLWINARRSTGDM